VTQPLVRRILSAGAVIVVGAALSFVGCGSSDEGTRGSSTPSATATPAGDDVLERLPEVPEATGSTPPPSGTGDVFLRAVFDDVQSLWQREFEAAGAQYASARMTIFRDEVDTACGAQTAGVGPFYCPADHGVYLDTRFFDALGRRAGVELGDFAQAFVVAHEVAHHVQTLLGILQRVRVADEQDPAGANARSVRLELQADCLAGIWKHSRYQRGTLTGADLEDALRAAAVVGSDFQQYLAKGTITPEDWTHGSARQRQQWLLTGFEQGTPSACDTFGP
jgi:uncharacterized protein